MKTKDKSAKELMKIAVKWCHQYIRMRDENKPCISCGEFKVLQAGHNYSSGHYPSLRFNEFNIHGQCQKCNMYLHGNLNEYRRKLPARIGQSKLDEIDFIADQYKRISFKWDRMELLQTIEYYKNKVKEL